MSIANQGRAFRILTAAELIWHNGHEFAIQAIASLLQHGMNVEYRIVGQGDFLEAVAYARHDFGLDAVVQILVEDYRSNLNVNLQWADVFLLAAVAHTNRHGLMDAIEQNKFVITTDIFETELPKEPNIMIISRRNTNLLAHALHSRILQSQ